MAQAVPGGAIDLSILVVNWNGAALTARCLDSVQRTRPPGLALEIILVDNGSHPADCEAIRERAHADGMRLIENSANLGFARANNQALAAASGRYLLLLNNDTEVLDGALAGLVAYMDRHPGVGIAGARLVGLDGRPRFSHDLFPLTPWRLAGERVLDALWPANRWTRRSRIARWGEDPREALAVDWVPGAAMIVRRAALAQVGPLDEGYSMYGEDIDWCCRMQRAGWQVAYVPQATIVHVGGGSSRAQPELVALLAQQRERSLLRFYRRHYGPAAAAGMGVILAVRRWRRRLLMGDAAQAIGGQP